MPMMIALHCCLKARGSICIGIVYGPAANIETESLKLDAVSERGGQPLANGVELLHWLEATEQHT